MKRRALGTNLWEATLVFLLALAPAVGAQTVTWTGAAGAVWDAPGSWNPNGVPTPTSNVFFGDVGAGSILLLNPEVAHSLTFATTNVSYNLSSSPPQANIPSEILDLTAIIVGPNVAATQTIGLNGPLGAVLFSGAGPAALTITNNSPSSLITLILSSKFLGTTTTDSPSGITVTGVGTTEIATPFIGSTNAVTGGLTKTGPGMLILSSNAANLQGTVTLAGGTMALDYSTDTSNKLGTGGAGALVGLDLSGGTLSVIGNASANVSQSVGAGSVAGTAIDTSHTDIQFTATGAATTTLNLAAITRFVGSTLDVGSTSNFKVQTSNGLFNGIVGGWATCGNGWATTSGGMIVQLPPAGYSLNTYAPGANTSVTTSGLARDTTNSLYFNVPGVVLNMDGSLTLQSGGILNNTDASGTAILGNGGALNSGTGELIIHAYGDLSINDCYLGNNNTLTKTGSRMLTFGGSDFGTIATVNVNRGGLRLASLSAVGILSTVNFNDNESQAYQTLAFQLPDNQNASTSAAFHILPAAQQNVPSPIQFINQAENSRITLTGVIGSAPGVTTGIQFSGTSANSSGFTLTGANTFTGDVALSGGYLGLSSNASLGNAGNALTLVVGSSTSGGLELLGPGIDLACPMTIISATRILNYGSDVDTVSGVIDGSGSLVKDGSGTLLLTGTNTIFGGIQINAGTLKVASLANLGANGNLTLAGGTLAATGSFTLPMNRSIFVGPTNGTGAAAIDVAAGQTVSIQGVIHDNYRSLGTLVKTGVGTLVLVNPINLYSGGTTVQQGVLQVTGDGGLGAASGLVTVGPLGKLAYTVGASTSRTFALNSGALSVAAGETLTFNGATIGGGFLTGPGTFSVTGGTAFTGVTTYASTVINQTGAGSYTNFTNGGPLTVAAGPATPVAMTRFTNQGSAAITVGAVSVVDVTDFQTYGTLTLNPAVAGSGQFTELANTGSSPLDFNGGSRTFIGTPQTANQGFLAGIDLHGQNAIVAGGLLVNNGFVADSTNSGATVVADFGSLVKGAGFFQNPVITQNGGKFQAGNSPGGATIGRFVLGPGGVDNYVFAIDDATGMAGPGPDVAGHVSGWGLVKAVQESFESIITRGDFTWTATPVDRLSVALQTLVNPTTVGMDIAGPMADFDPTKSYIWSAVRWAGTYSGPTGATALDVDTVFDTTGFLNPVAGTFGWSLDTADHTLSLTYTPTPVPEPGTLALSGMAAIGWLTFCWRRWHLK
jgi:fibronectin-binding autotransporter adhesin